MPSGCFYMVPLRKFLPGTKKGGGYQVHSRGVICIFLESGGNLSQEGGQLGKSGHA